jgi:excisionase family DNA binding protein
MITKDNYINYMSLDSYITIKEICQSLKVKKLTVYRWIKSGKLQAIKVGKSYRVTQQQIDNFINLKK